MELVPLKCPVCGGDIELNADREFGFCMHCGAKVAVDRSSPRNQPGSDDARRWSCMASDAFDCDDRADAYKYAVMAIDADDSLPEPWFYRAYCCSDSNEMAFSLTRFIALADESDPRRAVCIERLDMLNSPQTGSCEKVEVRISFPAEPLPRLKGSFSYFGTILDGRDLRTAKLGEWFSFWTIEGKHILELRQVNTGFLGLSVSKISRAVFLRRGSRIEVRCGEDSLDFDVVNDPGEPSTHF